MNAGEASDQGSYPALSDGVAPSMPAPISALNPAAFYFAADVARILFGRSLKWFHANRVKLTREEDFPKPFSQIGRPRWSGALLIAWCNRDVPQRPGAFDHSAPRPAGTNVVILEHELRARARAVAQSRRRKR